jgi:tetratricopeptide (TPR) repeat protein
LDLLYARGKNLESSDHLFVIRKQAMIVGLGFGWTNMTRGFLARAEHALTTARSMLASVNDPLVSAYVDLLYSTIQRCRAGSDQEQIEAVILQLQITRRTFIAHPRYQARTCWELALAKTSMGDITGAQKDLSVVASYADRTANQKWQVNVQILKSRIFQRQGKIEEALASAEMAINKAMSPESKAILPLVDAYLTRGETYLALAASTDPEKHYLNARRNFEDALQGIFRHKPTARTPDYLANPKIAAVCSLRIAQCYLGLGMQMNAKEHFATWLRLEPHVEHQWVRELAEQVRAEIEVLSMDFNISALDHNKWSYADNIARLRWWLLTQSLRQTNQNYSEAAKLIGVQRATLYQWQTQGRGKRNRIE